jgi:hypothetical protein
MVIATFRAGTPWAGQTIEFDVDAFRMTDGTRLTAYEVLTYANAGQLAWASPSTCGWVWDLARKAEQPTREASRDKPTQPSSSPTGSQPRTTPRKTLSHRPWFLPVSAAAAAFAVVGVVMLITVIAIIWPPPPPKPNPTPSSHPELEWLNQQLFGDSLSKMSSATASEKAYFMRVGIAFDHNQRIGRWDQPTVGVSLRGDYSFRDRQIVREMLGSLNDLIDEPQFVYATQTPEIVITFVPHGTFTRLKGRGKDAIGFCVPAHRTDSTLAGAHIYIDLSPRPHVAREGTIYHEFGHALGLKDTRSTTFRRCLMYYRANGASSFTELDRSAIDILYNSGLEPGDTRDEAQQAIRVTDFAP